MSGNRVRDERGDATTEAVLVAPVLILLVSVVISFGLWLHGSQVARSASQEGARAARVPGGSAALAEETTHKYLDQLGHSVVDEPAVHAERDDVVTRVEVRGKVTSAIPGLSLTVHAKASAPTESFRAAP